MPARKRKSTTIAAPARKSKRTRKALDESSDVVLIGHEDVEVISIASQDEPDEDLASILAKIREQEESEALARLLARESNQASSSRLDQVVYDLEDDERLARQLAKQTTPEPNDIIELDDSPETIHGASTSNKPRPANQLQVAKVRPDPKPTQPPDEALSAFRRLFTCNRACTKCGKQVTSRRGCVDLTGPESLHTLYTLLHAPCTCRTVHCRGCFKVISCLPACKGPFKNPACQVLECCAEIRAIALFETLGGFDRHFFAERAASNARAHTIEGQAKRKGKQSVGPGGTGYGTGTTTSLSSGKATKKRASAAQKKASDHWEGIILRGLELVISLLPEPYTSEPKIYDMLPHASIGLLISMSQLPSVLADLLNNDSVTDWTARKEVYRALLSILRQMAECELTLRCLISPRPESTGVCSIEDWMWEDNEIEWDKDEEGNVEMGPPLYTYFKKLTKQSEAFLSGVAQALGETEPETDEAKELIEATSLCGDIIVARDNLERALAILGHVDNPESSETVAPNEKGKGRDPAIDVEAQYSHACEKLAFKYIPLGTETKAGLDYYRYKYIHEVKNTHQATRQPKSRFHLLKELAVTATSLPPGIWVRVDEVRNDVIKIMIAGPEGTPYSGGLFEFDCFLPIEYPNQPPLLNLCTTGGGKVRFNPNLYNCGKVCLSLLGTWPGSPEEQWAPSKSTLLQVLVSIQSMILIDYPYFNEPGYGKANPNNAQSIEYNRNIVTQTIKWAILDWMEESKRDSIWKDVIRTHFTIYQDRIRQKITDANTVALSSTSKPRGRGKGKAKASVIPEPAAPQINNAQVAEFNRKLAKIQQWPRDEAES